MVIREQLTPFRMLQRAAQLHRLPSQHPPLALTSLPKMWCAWHCVHTQLRQCMHDPDIYGERPGHERTQAGRLSRADVVTAGRGSARRLHRRPWDTRLIPEHDNCCQCRQRMLRWPCWELELSRPSALGWRSSPYYTCVGGQHWQRFTSGVAALCSLSVAAGEGENLWFWEL